MTTDNEYSSPRETFRETVLWDIGAPLVLMAIPVGCFMLVGFFTKGLDTPTAKMPSSLETSLCVLQLVGMIALAVLILTRFDAANRKLVRLTGDPSPPAWRRLLLLLSIGCLLFSDIMTNVGVATHAEWLVGFALPMFAVYATVKQIAFVGLGPSLPPLEPPLPGDDQSGVDGSLASMLDNLISADDAVDHFN